MRDVCLIAAYTPDQAREDMLRNLTRSLKGKKDMVLISHTITPKDILDDVQYYFYDFKNELLTLDQSPPFWWFQDLGDAIIYSNDIWYTTHIQAAPVGFQILPVTRNFFFGLSICKLLSYDCVHYIEYDCRLKSTEFLDQNVKLLDNYDGLVYWNNIHNHPHGAYQCYNLNSYTFSELRWDRDSLLTPFYDLLKKPFDGITESFVFSKMSANKNIHKRNLLELSSVLDSCSSNVKGKYDYVPCIILISDEGIVSFFSKNILQYEINVSLNVNGNENLSYKIKPGFWNLNDIGNINDTKLLEIYLNNEKIKEYKFLTQESIQTHKKNNYKMQKL